MTGFNEKFSCFDNTVSSFPLVERGNPLHDPLRDLRAFDVRDWLQQERRAD
jgi:hypothetical protein